MGSMLAEARDKTGMHVLAPFDTNGTQYHKRYATNGMPQTEASIDHKHTNSAHRLVPCTPLAALLLG
jgi:hypothetical protein